MKYLKNCVILHYFTQRAKSRVALFVSFCFILAYISPHCFQFDFRQTVFTQYYRGIVDLSNAVSYLAMTLINSQINAET